MSARVKPDAPPNTVLTAAEINALDCIDAARARSWPGRQALADYLLQIAMLGGHLARNPATWSSAVALHTYMTL